MFFGELRNTSHASWSDGCRFRLCKWWRGDNQVELINQTGSCRNCSCYLWCQANFPQGNPASLFPHYQSNQQNKQGNDVGTQYRTGVYYTDDKDLEVINQVFDEVNRSTSSSWKGELEEFCGGWGLPPRLSQEKSKWLLPYQCQSGSLSRHWCQQISQTKWWGIEKRLLSPEEYAVTRKSNRTGFFQTATGINLNLVSMWMWHWRTPLFIKGQVWVWLWLA